MVLAGLGLNPAGVSLFRMHAPQSPLTGLNPRVLRALILVVASSFVCGCIASSFCFFRPSERNVRHFFTGDGFGRFGLESCWGFPSEAKLESVTGDGLGRFGLESCWGFPVSHACPTEPFDEELASA